MLERRKPMRDASVLRETHVGDLILGKEIKKGKKTEPFRAV